MVGPYDGLDPDQWLQKTEALIESHPLSADELVDVVLTSWKAIFESRLGGKFRIGHEINPKPQIMGFLLHELIPLELQSRFAGLWRPEKTKDDKDIVYVPDDTFSIELKTSSHKSQIFGNRSYAQAPSENGKSKNGFYLAVNFEKFGPNALPSIRLIRFGWLDHTDWIGQKAATGQQARLGPETDRYKLLKIYSSSD